MLLVRPRSVKVQVAEPVEDRAQRVSAPRRPRSLTAGGKISTPLMRWTSMTLNELEEPVRALQLPRQLSEQRFLPPRGYRCPHRCQITVLEPSLNVHFLQTLQPWRSRLQDSEEMVMGPDAVAEDIVAGSDCRDTAAPEENVREDEVMNFKKWFDVPVLEVDLTRMPNLKQALRG